MMIFAGVHFFFLLSGLQFPSKPAGFTAEEYVYTTGEIPVFSIFGLGESRAAVFASPFIFSIYTWLAISIIRKVWFLAN